MALDCPKASPSRAAARSTVAARFRSDLAMVAASGGPVAIFPASPRGALQLRRRDHPVDQADPEGLGRVDDLGRQHHLLGLGETDQPLEEPGAAAVGHEPDLEEHLAELCAVRGHDHVAAERDVAARPYREAVHHGDGGLGKVEQAEDEAVEELHALSPLGRGVTPRGHGLHVASGREMPARAGENDCAHRRVALDLVEGLHQLLAHANVEGVARLRPVHGKRRDAIDAVNEEGLVSHRYLPPATGWKLAAHGPLVHVDGQGQPRAHEEKPAGDREGEPVAAGDIVEEARGSDGEADARREENDEENATATHQP